MRDHAKAPRPRLLPLAAPLLVLTTLLGTGCSSIGTVQFRCDPQINGGLLLTVDVVRADETQTQQIRQLGEKWFYDPMRESLRDRISTVTFPVEGSALCERVVEIPVPKEKLVKYLVIIADYKYQNPDPTKQLVVLPREKWAGQKVKIGVHDKDLSVATNF